LDPALLHSINPEDLMPLGVDDEFISEYEVVTDASTQPCLVTGFIFHSRVFWAAIRSPCPTQEDLCPCVRSKDQRAQVSYFQERLNCLQNLLTDIPPFLLPWESTGENFNTNATDEKAKIIGSQMASLRANLHVTHLWLQSLILDQLEAAQSHQRSQPSVTSLDQPSTALDQRLLWIEREKLCRQMFFILFNFPRISLEANGLHLANKVRDIAASLLACPFHPDDPISKQAAEYIQLSTDVLSRLDSSESMNTMHLQTWVDTDRIHN
jgi:hypothetical protein